MRWMWYLVGTWYVDVNYSPSRGLNFLMTLKFGPSYWFINLGVYVFSRMLPSWSSPKSSPFSLNYFERFFFFFLLSLKISFFIVYLHQLQVAGFLWVGHVTLSSCFIENRINCQSGAYDILHYLSIFNTVG